MPLEKTPSTDSMSSLFSSSFKDIKASTCFIPYSSIVSFYISNALLSGGYANVACSIIRL